MYILILLVVSFGGGVAEFFLTKWFLIKGNPFALIGAFTLLGLFTPLSPLGVGDSESRIGTKIEDFMERSSIEVYEEPMFLFVVTYWGGCFVGGGIGLLMFG